MVRKPAPTQEQIREAAYHLWLKANRPHGREEEFWFQAEAELSKPAPRAKAGAKPAAKPVTKTAAKSTSKAAAKKKPAPRKRASKAAGKS